MSNSRKLSAKRSGKKCEKGRLGSISQERDEPCGPHCCPLESNHGTSPSSLLDQNLKLPKQPTVLGWAFSVSFQRHLSPVSALSSGSKGMQGFGFTMPAITLLLSVM